MPSRRKNHCHELRRAIPSMLVSMAAERRPEKTLEMMLPACQMPMRRGDSCLVYHEDVL